MSRHNAHGSNVGPSRLACLDHRHVWHPFTPMGQWRQSNPLIIERGEGPFLFDVKGRRFIDGVSSLWCNVHGHCVPRIDQAIREQLTKVAHTTFLGLASPPGIELAARLCETAPSRLNKVFYSDAGATAVEVAFKMAVGYWHHRGQPRKNRFIGLAGAYHGDTTGAMSVGFNDLFHRPFASMVFDTSYFPTPDACRPPRSLKDRRANLGRGPPESRHDGARQWPSEDPVLGAALLEYCLAELEALLEHQVDETAAIVIEPVMQGAAGMICQPTGFARRVSELARKFKVLLIADEVATGFGRTGRMFSCEHEGVEPDLLCLAKGLSGGYLPLATTLATDEIEEAFCGELHENRTLYHGHTYTGNALACAAALASLDLFEATGLIDHINISASIIADRLGSLRDTEKCPHVLDVRQRGLMVGIELRPHLQNPLNPQPINYSSHIGTKVCLAMRDRGLLIRPLGNVVVLMPIPAMDHDILRQMMDIVVETICDWPVTTTP